MDGFPIPKNKTYGGQLYSETRYAVIKWLEKELPQITGDVINISSGNWPVPKQLLTNKGLKSYKTCDQKTYGDNQNKVDYVADVHHLPQEWTNKWDCVINNQAIECYENPFKAMDEMYRILKPGGVLLIDAPFNYVFFGYGANKESLKKKNKVNDYWRITKNGWELLTKKFNKVSIEGFGGSGDNDRFVYCVKAIKQESSSTPLAKNIKAMYSLFLKDNFDLKNNNGDVIKIRAASAKYKAIGEDKNLTRFLMTYDGDKKNREMYAKENEKAAMRQVVRKK